MAPTQSRSQRKAAFMQAANAMYERLEAWYDAHPTATFEEIEAAVRPQRRELAGGRLATLIVGRDSGFQASAPPCPQCQQPMTFEGYRAWTVKGLEGDSVLKRAYYVCPACAGRLFPPLDQKLALRADHWSGGTARVATRLGLQAKSFDLAAAGFSDAVGCSISGDSLARLTEGWGQRVEAQRTQEAVTANQPGQRGERLGVRCLAGSQRQSPRRPISRPTGPCCWCARKVGRKSRLWRSQRCRPNPPAPGRARRLGGVTWICWSSCGITATKPACGMPIRWPCTSIPRGCAAVWITAHNVVRSMTAPSGSSALPL